MTVATGTAAAQAIGMAFAPLITRLYGPEMFGLQSIFVSLVGILTVMASMSYPIAIVLPKDDADALGLVKLSLLIATIFCSIYLLVISYIGVDLLAVLKVSAIGDFVYLVPPAVFVSVLLGVLNQWLIRKKAYGISARYTVLTTFLISSTKCGLGFLHPSAIGLILTNIVGALFGVCITFFAWHRHQRRQKSVDAVWPEKSEVSIGVLARKHYDFALFRTPQNLINGLSQSMPILILAAYFGAAAAGYYSIVVTVLGIPTKLIGGSVMAVFYPRINEAKHNGEDMRSLIVRATVGMAVVGAFPFILVISFGPWLFEFVFGAEWKTAGEYAQWLSAWLFLQYINKPAVSAIPVLKMQGSFLGYEIISIAVKVLALWLGLVIFKSDIVAIAMFSISGTIAYIFLIVWVIRRSGKVSVDWTEAGG